MESLMSKYVVMDETGKVRQWLDAGRGLRVWTCQEIGSLRGDTLTPGDVTTEPHWSYKGGDRLISKDDVVFFQKVGVAYFPSLVKRTEFSDAPSGWKAAQATLHKLPTDNGNAPVKLKYQYTIERVCYQTEEKRADGRPLGTHYAVAIIHWCAPRE